MVPKILEGSQYGESFTVILVVDDHYGQHLIESMWSLPKVGSVGHLNKKM